ncbi:unnamed protein product, partial [marine sediment metagenome]
SDLLAAQVVGNKELFEEDYSTSIFANSLVMVQNGTGVVYSSLSIFGSWESLITQGNICYLDLDFTFNAGVSDGEIDVTVYIIES